MMIDRQCSLSLGGAYHTTSLNNLVSIMKNGLMPGGLGDRTTTFMLPFGPWDSRSTQLVKSARLFNGEKRICLYLGAGHLETFNCRLTTDGNIVTQMVIPFECVDAVWMELTLSPSRWIRLLVRTDQLHVISSIEDCGSMASLAKGKSLLRSTVEEAPEKYNDIKEALVKIKEDDDSGVNSLVQGEDLWNNMVSLLALCYLPNESNHILCPGCLGEKAQNISICVLCMGTLRSHGTIIRRKVKTEMDHDGDAKNVPSSSGIKVEEAEDIPEADISDDIVPDEPEEDESKAKADDMKVDDENVTTGEASRTKFDAEVREDIIQGEGSVFRMSDGSVLTSATLVVPAWLAEWSLGTKAMQVEEAISLDSFPRAGEIIDGLIATWLYRSYKVYISDLALRSRQSLLAQISSDRANQNRYRYAYRRDLSSKWPDFGEDENGQPRDPTDDEFWYFHNGDHLSKDIRKRDKARDNLEDFKLAFQGSQIMRDIAKYLVNCGWTHEDVRRELKPSQEGMEMTAGRGLYPWGSAEYEKWRRIAWEDMKRNSQLVRRAIAGTYNCNSYTYFRPEATYNNTKYLNPLAIILAVRPEDVASLHCTWSKTTVLSSMMLWRNRCEEGLPGLAQNLGMLQDGELIWMKGSWNPLLTLRRHKPRRDDMRQTMFRTRNLNVDF